MKTQLLWMVLILAIGGCAELQTLNDEKSSMAEIPEDAVGTFMHARDFPTIKDTTEFITDLKQVTGIDDTGFQKKNGKITTYKKIKIYGSDNDYLFVECDFMDGSSAAFPWKYQCILTIEGKPVKVISGQRFDFVEIFANENPFLLVVVGTSKGNGGHKLYRISADTLQNVYEGYEDLSIRTFDAHQDNMVYEPNELIIEVKDYNSDGYNDISFNGTMLLIQKQSSDGYWYDDEVIHGKSITYSVDNPFDKISIEFIFLYDRHSGRFRAKENYMEKYGLDY